MDLKRFLFIFALWAVTTSLGAQTQVTPPRVPVPPPANTPGNPPVAVPARPAGNARTPLGPPSPGGPPAPGFPTSPPPTVPVGNPASTPTAATAGTNSPDGDKADISYTFPAIPVAQLLDIYADLVNRTLLTASGGQEAIPATATVTLK